MTYLEAGIHENAHGDLESRSSKVQVRLERDGLGQRNIVLEEKNVQGPRRPTGDKEMRA